MIEMDTFINCGEIGPTHTTITRNRNRNKGNHKNIEMSITYGQQWKPGDATLTRSGLGTKATSTMLMDRQQHKPRKNPNIERFSLTTFVIDERAQSADLLQMV